MSTFQQTMSVEDIVSTSENSVLFNVFQMPFLSDEQCKGMAKQVLDHRYTNKHESSMQKHTVDVTSFLGGFLKDTVETLTPTINNLFYFEQPNTYSLYTAHSIIYSATEEGEKQLGIHVDDSDITVNITLMTEDLRGSELGFWDSTEYGNDFCLQHFEKVKQNLSRQTRNNTLNPQVGWCLIHRGDHPHCTFSIQRGKRMALILWLKKKNTLE